MPTDPSPQANVAEYISALTASPRFGPQVVHHEEIAASQAEFSELQDELPPSIIAALSQMGQAKLFSHQSRAIDLIRQGQDVIIATPTASGKSLIYNIPVFEKLLTDPDARALYLFPLKALAQDQLRGINEFAAHIDNFSDNLAVICDGDTSSYRRKKIRENPPRILITNPDMLHLSMLGYNDNWAGFWDGLSHIIIDEVHSYRGVFGSHMVWVLRRLLRICAKYGAKPQFILSSATVGNPDELGANLLDRPVATITESAAPRGQRHFIFLDPHDSAAYAASQLLEAALKRGLRAIAYTQSRKMTELIYMWTRDRLGDIKHKLTSYRAGFLPEERREIEAKLSSGALLGVISTSALELGIDIGALDICILVGYPGTIMATWQRGGRVGRRQHDSLIILVGQEDALDQHFMRNPADFFARGVEDAVLNPQNRTIMKKHLLCAAVESPLKVGESIIKTDSAGEVIAELAAEGQLLLAADGKSWYTGRKYPHREVDLRGSGKSFTIKDAGEKGRELGRIDGLRCLQECHPGAIYLHRGQTYLITDLDLSGHTVTALKKQVNYFTRALSNKETEVIDIYKTVRRTAADPDFSYQVSLGSLKVTDTITGFQRRLVRGHRLLNTEPLNLPPVSFTTEGLWIEIPPALQEKIEQLQAHFMGGIHALEHAAIGIFPLLVLCDRNDIGGISYPFHPQIKSPAVFIYDGQAGGVGLCREAFGKIDELLNAALTTITSCPCDTGCPSCVHSPKCGSGNRPIDKNAARLLLEGLLAEKDATFKEVKLKITQTETQDTAPAPAQSLPDHYGVFDIETQRSAAEVGGWHRADRMLVSVAILYDSRLDEFLTFRESEVAQLIAHLQTLDLVIGFNNSRFDNKVLSAYTDFDLNSLPTLDILTEVKNRLGYRLSLDGLASQTLDTKKSADGLQALKWYKEGRIDKIIEYCRQDVRVTRDLFLFGLQNKYLLFKNKAGQVVRCPVDFQF